MEHSRSRTHQASLATYSQAPAETPLSHVGQTFCGSHPKYYGSGSQRLAWRKGAAIKLADNGEVAQGMAVVPLSLRHAPVHPHPLQVHNASQYNLALTGLQQQNRFCAKLCYVLCQTEPNSKNFMPLGLQECQSMLSIC